MKDYDLSQFAKSGLNINITTHSSGYVETEDAKIYFLSFGLGIPIILLHGGLGNSSNWNNQVEFLVNNGFKVILVDSRGHGRSSSGTREFSYKLFAQDLNLIIKELGLESPIIVGWSDGGCIALELARMNITSIKGIVFFACNVNPDGLLEFKMSKTIDNCLKRHREDYRNSSINGDDFENLELKLRNMQNNELDYTQAEFDQIQVPVAVIQGEDDEFIKLSHAKYISESIKESYFEVMIGVSHFAPIQDPVLFNKTILKYINKIINSNKP